MVPTVTTIKLTYDFICACCLKTIYAYDSCFRVIRPSTVTSDIICSTVCINKFLGFCAPTTTINGSEGEQANDEVGFSISPDDDTPVTRKCTCPMDSFNAPLKNGRCSKCGGV